MVLLEASCLVLTQVSVDGSFLGDLFLGMGAAFVAGSIALLAASPGSTPGQPPACRPPPSNMGTAVGSRSCRRSPSRGPTTSSQPPTSRPRRRSR
jgi:hypothetical protein